MPPESEDERSPCAPHVLVETLSCAHHHGLTRRQLQLLGALEFGYSVSQIASGNALTPGTVRRELTLLAHRVLEPRGIEPSRGFLRKWTSLHYSCCTRPALMLAEEGQLFDCFDQFGK